MRSEMKKVIFKRFNCSNGNRKRKSPIIKTIVINFAVTTVIMIGATLLSFYFRDIGFHESNIIITYILGVLFVARYTDAYIYGIIASAIGVLTFNFFFTEPYYTFLVYRSDYPITFIIMLLAAIVTSTLTVQVKREARISSLREKRTRMLYEISKKLLEARDMKQIADIAGNSAAKMFDCPVIIAIANVSGFLGEPIIYNFRKDTNYLVKVSEVERQAILECYTSQKSVEISSKRFESREAYYLPIHGQSSTFGVIGVLRFNMEPLYDEQKVIFKAIALQIAAVLDREQISEKQQKTVLDIEKERMRGNLLRAISHDLRTPLTGILGATSTILDNEDYIDKTVKRELLLDIHEHTKWLIHTVENILSMTQIDEGRILIKKKMEVVEEIIAESVSRIKTIAEKHIIKINIPDNIIMIPVDGMLIERVIINLIDNAIKYTSEGSTIEIKVYEEKEKVSFEIIDNGSGIPEADLPFIFDRFFTKAKNTKVGKRGIGLGLAICKSIIVAHGGEITAFNNYLGGATFKFTIPAKE